MIPLKGWFPAVFLHIPKFMVPTCGLSSSSQGPCRATRLGHVWYMCVPAFLPVSLFTHVQDVEATFFVQFGLSKGIMLAAAARFPLCVHGFRDYYAPLVICHRSAEKIGLFSGLSCHSACHWRDDVRLNSYGQYCCCVEVLFPNSSDIFR